MMNVCKWDPFKEMEAVLDRYRPARYASGQNRVTADWYPCVDVAETERAFHIHAELPGVKKTDIKISLEGGVLTLKGSRESKVEDKQNHCAERSYGKFVRSFAIPENVLTEKVEANFQEGVLEIDLPKSQQEKPKQVEIKVG